MANDIELDPAAEAELYQEQQDIRREAKRDDAALAAMQAAEEKATR